MNKKRKWIKWVTLLCLFVLLLAACGHSDSTDETDSQIEGETDLPSTELTVPEYDTNKAEEIPEMYNTKLDEVLIENDNAKLSVIFDRRDLVHFRYGTIDEEFLPESYSVSTYAIYKTDAEYDPVMGAVESEQKDGVDYTYIRTSVLTVRVNSKTLGIQISTQDGKVVFESAAEAFAAKGEERSVSFVRDVAGTEHFFGLGNDREDDFQTLDHRNTVFQLILSDHNVHAIVPLWYSTNGYGVYLNNSNMGKIDFTKDYHVTLEGGEMNFFFIWGPSFQTILTNWSELCGRTTMPPLYSLGLTYRGFGSFTADQLYATVKKQLDYGVKIDIAGVEPGWQSATYPCSYTWKSTFSSDPKSFIQSLHDLGVRVNLWEHPYISSKATIYNAIKQYCLSGTDIGNRKWEGGNDRTYGFGGLIPDLTIKEAQDIYWSAQNDYLVSIGVDGFKMDETDSWGASNSLSMLFPSGISNNAYHNLLGTLTVNLIHEKYKSEYNQRTFMYSRGNYAGMQRYPTSAYTDYYGFKQFAMSVATQSYSGTYYTPEIRDVSTKSDSDYMRRAQLMFLTPFAMSNEWASDANVLMRNQSVIDCYLKYNELHYELIPYMYSLFWNQHNTGIGVTRALPFEFQDDAKTYNTDTQFMLGDSILVCPVSGEGRMATVDIYLPKGETWIDLNDGHVYEGGKTISYTCSASVMPIFIRAGAIIPLGSYGKNTSDVTDTTLKIAIYPSEKTTSFNLYEDDGISFGYENGNYAETEIKSVMKDKIIRATLYARTGAYAVTNRDCIMQFHYRAKATAVMVDGHSVPEASSLEALASMTTGWFYDDNENDINKIIYVKFQDDGKTHEVLLQVGEQSAQGKPVVFMEGTIYECENSANNFNGVGKKFGASFASGKGYVNNLTNGHSLTINNVKVEKDGSYEVEIVYINGNSVARELAVSVNGGTPIVLICPTTNGWEIVGSLIIPLSLKAGNNTITFSTVTEGASGPDLDCLIVYDKEPIQTNAVGTVYAVKDAIILGTSDLVANSTFSGGYAVTNFGGVDDNGGFSQVVTVPSEGPYQLSITYANGKETDMTLILNVNGEESELVLPTTYSEQLTGTISSFVYLKAGENTISIYAAGGALKYECEVGGEYKNCNNHLNDGVHEHSGGYGVGATSNDGKAYFTMKGITVPDSDYYDIYIYAASGDTRTFRLKVNGESTDTLYKVQSGHFHIFKPTKVTVYLQKGENQITIYQDAPGHGDSSWLPNFDYIEFDDLGTNVQVMIGEITIQ